MTLTSCLPILLPFSIPMNAAGAFSNPSVTLFSVLQFSRLNPFRHLSESVIMFVRKFKDEKSLNLCPFDDEVPQKTWSLFRILQIILGNLTAD